MKKFFLMIISLILCLSTFSFVFAGFEDVANTKYETAVDSLADMNVINGMPNGSFEPYSNVTRAQFAKMLVEALDIESATANLSFSDLDKTHWAIEYINIASANKIVNGYEDGTFRPEDNVLYAEAVTMVMRAIGKDVGLSSTGAWYNKYMNKASNINLLTEITGVDAEKNLNRGDTAILISNMLNLPVEEIELDDFTLSFLKLENNERNMVYSPLSIKYALKMLKDGADGNTKAEIEDLIKELGLTKYENIKDVLSLANSVYVREKYKENILKEYTDALAQNYNAELKYDSFESAVNINNWIEEKTLGIIKNLLDDSAVQDPAVIMLLINALAIDMEWGYQFDEANTYGRNFELSDGTTMVATTMSTRASTDETHFYVDDDITVLSKKLKKYGDIQLEFVAIMPEENLSEYVSKVTMEDLNEIIADLKPASSQEAKDGLQITIPKFSYDYTLNLKQDLNRLGIKDAFSPNSADFSKISQDIDLFVGNAIHKADIEFSEEGIKAAAVTVFIMAGNAMIQDPPEYVYINIDKPFMYLIRDVATGEVWFVGTVYEPNLWENDKAEYKWN